VLCQNDLLVWFLLARAVHLRENKRLKVVTQFLQNVNWNAEKTQLVLEFPLEKVKLLIGTDASSSMKETPSQLILAMIKTLTPGGRAMTALKLSALRKNALIVPSANSTEISNGPLEAPDTHKNNAWKRADKTKTVCMSPFPPMDIAT